MAKTVNVLGTDYSIEVRKFDDYPEFKRRNCDGFCIAASHQIILCDMHTWPDWEVETDESIDGAMRQTLRHEIVHAFLNESGLADSTSVYGHGWATNEEMVDWIAAQGPKIHAAWTAVGAL